MAVVQVGLAPLLNIVTVCGMRMHAKHEQSKNHIKQAQMLRKVTHCAGRVLAHTRPHQLHWGVCQENSYCRVLVQPKAEKLLGHAWKTELPFQLGKIVSCHVHIYEKVVQHATKPNSHLYSGIRPFYCPLSFSITPQDLLQLQQPHLQQHIVWQVVQLSFHLRHCSTQSRKPHPHCEGRGLRDHSLFPSTDIATTVCSSLVNVGLTKKN